VITPDNDGFNEFLIIDCLRAGASQFPDNELIILNQWGDEIYRASPYDNTWDGTYEGEPVPDGTYFYIFKESDGVPVQKGFITVIR
jgi:gliding motility-associated-like protein